MENAQISCADYEISADFYQGEKDEVLLVLPGYTSSKKSYRPLVEGLAEKTRMSMLVIDYSGHGKSPFELEEVTPAQNFSEVVAAFDWLVEQKGFDPKKINVMGTSYGGFHGANLTKFRNFNKLVLRVPAIYAQKDFYTKHGDVEDIHRREYRYDVDGNNFDDHWLFKEQIFNGDTYVLTHSLDDVCPQVSTDVFIEGLNAVDTWQAEGFKHGLGESEYTQVQLEEYQNKIASWLKL